jgi:anaphase-promoting complex subunit 8
MGHEHVELKQTGAAIEAYRRAVDINAHDYRAWYGLGQTYEINRMYYYALYYYRKACTLRPYDARMWCALGGCFENLGRQDDAVRCFERAIANRDMEHIALLRLARLYRDSDQPEKAAPLFERHLEGEIARRNAQGDEGGDGGVTEPPSDDTVEALVFLATFYKDQRQLSEAQKCVTRLLDHVGATQKNEEALALLREIRAMEGSEHLAAEEARPEDGGMRVTPAAAVQSSTGRMTRARAAAARRGQTSEF